ncbi:mitochondrial import protein MMP37 [Plectosphaerella cucumerina]|uniref:Phosphatidate cytidylyltransferase, mitochondrial n=1 Tax=Plectosphaerella cucumerina TaxID=40658 RepID=A0A8K0WZR4_9PEZI|nr:mitochondrial import protein MMP37 [Plectosphaerella cucumerina]
MALTYRLGRAAMFPRPSLHTAAPMRLAFNTPRHQATTAALVRRYSEKASSQDTQANPSKTEPPKTEPPKTEPPKTEPPKTDANKAEEKPPAYVHHGSAINFAFGQKYQQKKPREGPVLDAKNWEDHADAKLEDFTELPYKLFGTNQHMDFNVEFKKELTQLLRSYRAPIMYAFAYGSGVFPQAKPSRTITDDEFKVLHPRPSHALKEVQASGPRSIDLIFGVSHTQHWHSLNMRQHPEHYSFLSKFGSGLVSTFQDRWGAGVYFNPYVTQSGMQIKYGVVSLDNLCTDLSSWNNLYLAGRLQKPVKILRDHPRVRLANQVNLISAVRTALLLLPPRFTERELYATIAGLSYLGDPRMALPTESPSKVNDIVDNNMLSFRRLYSPLLSTLPNVNFVTSDDKKGTFPTDSELDAPLEQDMDPIRRANMVRRLPKTFRSRLYFQYQKKLMVPKEEFQAMIDASRGENPESFERRATGGGFERRIVEDDPVQLRAFIRRVIKQTVNWPATAQSLKGIFTAGPARAIRYMLEKWSKYRKGRAKMQQKALEAAQAKTDGSEKKGSE